MKPDYKKIYQRLEMSFPAVARKLNPKPQFNDLSELPSLFMAYCETTGLCRDEVKENKNNSRLIFIAVIILMSDPLFFDYPQQRVTHRLEHHLAGLFDCNRKQILHNLKNVKSFWKVYPKFKKEVEHIYAQMKNLYEKK